MAGMKRRRLTPDITPEVLIDLVENRRDAIEKHGDQDAADLLWIAVENEEAGEVCKAVFAEDYEAAYEECLDAAGAFLFHAESLMNRRGRSSHE